MALRWKKVGSDYEATAPEGTYTIEGGVPAGHKKARYDLYLEHSNFSGTGFSRANMGWFGALAKAKAKASYYHRNVIID